MNNVKSSKPEHAVSQGRRETEIDRELSLLSAALSTFSMGLGSLIGQLETAGVLSPPLPEPEMLSDVEASIHSPMGNRIHGIRSDIQSLTNDLQRVMGRMAI